MLTVVKYFALVATALALPRNETAGICGTGRFQSPIDVKANNIEFSTAKANHWLPNLNYTNSNQKDWVNFFPGNASVLLGRHSSGAMVITPLANDFTTVKIWDGPMGGEYTLSEIHYYYGASQHSFDNRHQYSEFQWIFVNSLGALAPETTAKSRVVLSVLVSRGNQNTEFQKIITEMNKTATSFVAVAGPVSGVVSIDLNKLLPPNWWFEFYTYQGSLTYPPCAESATYIIAARTLPLWWMNIDAVPTKFNTTHSNRLTQPHWSRNVAKSFGGNNCQNNGLFGGGLGGLGGLFGGGGFWG